MGTGFTKYFERKVYKTIKKYKLLNKRDKVIVACSGGKDSTVALYLLKKFGYDVEALTINLLIGEWSKKNLENITKFCEDYEIKLHIVDVQKEFGFSIAELKNCTICGIIKRWLINKKARELNATKIATGHNLNDEVETILLNIFNGNLALSAKLGPKVGIIKDKKFVQRIKPLYFCTDEEIKKYSKIMKFQILYKPCPYSANSFRKCVREFLYQIRKKYCNSEITITNNFLNKILPIVRKEYLLENKLKYCNICGEPTNNKICKACKLIMAMKH